MIVRRARRCIVQLSNFPIQRDLKQFDTTGGIPLAGDLSRMALSMGMCGIFARAATVA